MKNLLKLGLVVLITSTIAFAQEKKEGKSEKKVFADKKMMQLEKLDTRITRLTKIKDCISEATKQKEIKVCKKNNPQLRKMKKEKINK